MGMKITLVFILHLALYRVSNGDHNIGNGMGYGSAPASPDSYVDAFVSSYQHPMENSYSRRGNNGYYNDNEYQSGEIHYEHEIDYENRDKSYQGASSYDADNAEYDQQHARDNEYDRAARMYVQTSYTVGQAVDESNLPTQYINPYYARFNQIPKSIKDPKKYYPMENPYKNYHYYKPAGEHRHYYQNQDPKQYTEADYPEYRNYEEEYAPTFALPPPRYMHTSSQSFMPYYNLRNYPNFMLPPSVQKTPLASSNIPHTIIIPMTTPIIVPMPHQFQSLGSQPHHSYHGISQNSNRELYSDSLSDKYIQSQPRNYAVSNSSPDTDPVAKTKRTFVTKNEVAPQPKRFILRLTRRNDFL